MHVQRSEPQASVAEVLDRVLDRGIVIDAWLRVSVAGITLIDVDARIVVAAIDTYVEQAAAIAGVPCAARPITGSSAARSIEPTRSTRPRGRRVALRCDAGCTFVRRVSGSPARVRCPSHRGGVCPVTRLQDPA
jgi:gas vesicle structural protein